MEHQCPDTAPVCDAGGGLREEKRGPQERRSSLPAVASETEGNPPKILAFSKGRRWLAGASRMRGYSLHQ